MALVKCPECQKEISDTVKKCPHCGFKQNKSENKKLNGILEKLKNNKKLSIIGAIFILILIIIIAIIIFISGRYERLINNVAEVLEDEGYNCRERSEGYLCKKENGDKEYEFNLSWDNEGSWEIVLNYKYKDIRAEINYMNYVGSNFNYIDLINPYGEKFCHYIPSSVDSAKTTAEADTTFYEDGKAVDSPYSNECGRYEEDVNEILDEFKIIADEVEK